MQIYGLKNCDTCRKAIKALPEAEFIDVRADGVSEAVLTKALAAFPESLLNTRSTTWRSIDEAERAKAPLELLKAYPALMKRPLIVSGGDVHLGWTAKTQAALGL